MLKYLRIAVTALSLTACVLLIALWVRSYYSQWNISSLSLAPDYRSLMAGEVSLIGFPNLTQKWDSKFEVPLKTGMKPRRPDPSTQKRPASVGKNPSWISIGRTVLVPFSSDSHWCNPLDAPNSVAFLPPHSADRHDAGCDGAGRHCVQINQDERAAPSRRWRLRHTV